MATVTGWPRDGYLIHADELSNFFAGLIRRDDAGLPIPGVLGALKGVAVPSAWQVEISPLTFVELVNTTGVRLSGESAASLVDITPAAGSVPAGQSRIDLICWDTEAAAFSVVEGFPAVTPAVPSSGGSEPLFQVVVAAGDGQVIQGQITPVYAVTALAGDSRVDKGYVSPRSIPARSTITVPITFKAGLFDVAPNIQLTATGGTTEITLLVDNRTAAGCDVVIRSDLSIARSVGVMWRAEQ